MPRSMAITNKIVLINKCAIHGAGAGAGWWCIHKVYDVASWPRWILLWWFRGCSLISPLSRVQNTFCIHFYYFITTGIMMNMAQTSGSGPVSVCLHSLRLLSRHASPKNEWGTKGLSRFTGRTIVYIFFSRGTVFFIHSDNWNAFIWLFKWPLWHACLECGAH